MKFDFSTVLEIAAGVFIATVVYKLVGSKLPGLENAEDYESLEMLD